MNIYEINKVLHERSSRKILDVGSESNLLFNYCQYENASGAAHLKCIPANIRSSQEAVCSVYGYLDPQVGVLVGGVDFLALNGHISGQLPAYSHYPALGGIHSHFPSVRPFGYGVQCIL
ncbi:hypothetical protein AYI70_g7398 [Smittium culicis]|uniref:Uncharacterized protein n=1 Tax=Smittium culicis TaxID=133412 RepID=A0A1R1XKV1_9FUNG|nr:hypothetical protein AYI70_g7398 [Smittium culicis]